MVVQDSPEKKIYSYTKDDVLLVCRVEVLFLMDVPLWLVDTSQAQASSQVGSYFLFFKKLGK